nr:YlmH/Sll1252 family protein [uncultured Caproiciproducens sp.]
MDKLSADTIFEAKLCDAVRLAQSGVQPRFVGFLDERQALAAQKIMNHIPFKNYMLCGGYDGSERVVFGAFPDFIAPDAAKFPITPVTASYRSCDELSHRDFLGALLANGIQRETLGDILVEEGRCVIFSRSEITDYILSQTTKIGRVGVQLAKGASQPLPLGRNFEDFSAVVASARLDCIVAAAIGTSREKSSEMIRAGLVMLNHEVNTSISAIVTQDSKLSIRGKGRFVLDRLGPMTKKGRLSIAGRKYI